MSGSNSVDYRVYYTQYINKLKEKAKVAVADALNKTWKEFFIIAESDIQGIFNSAIDEFYDSYSPEIYERTLSLYNLLVTEIGDSGMSLTISFNPDNMSGFRSGYHGEDGLYDQVFRKGWHGGADKIDSDKAKTYKEHPSPGTPYWRNPHPYYTFWGYPAEISTPPLDIIKHNIATYQNVEIQAKFDEIWNKYKSQIRIR